MQARRPLPRRPAVLLAAAALALTACGGGGTAGGSPGPKPSGTRASSAASSSRPSPDHASSSPSGASTTPAPETALLRWRTVPGPVGDAVTTDGDWTVTVDRDGGGARLTGPRTLDVSAGPRGRITDVLLDDDWAVVVAEDTRAERGDVATVVALHDGRRFVLDGSSSPPTTTGGTWALGGSTLVHATVGPGRAYCLATVDLSSRTGSRGWCAEKRHGFNGARVTEAGTTLMSFDDHHPSCRTLERVTGTTVTPLDGITPCKGWDALLTPDGQVWSEVPKDRRVEAAHLFARAGHTTYDLGPGVSGTLTWCGGSAWFTRDPQRSGEPARLMRWTGTSLQVAFESRGRGRAFLSPPRCGGDHLTLTAYDHTGDRQVTTTID